MMNEPLKRTIRLRDRNCGMLLHGVQKPWKSIGVVKQGNAVAEPSMVESVYESKNT